MTTSVEKKCSNHKSFPLLDTGTERNIKGLLNLLGEMGKYLIISFKSKMITRYKWNNVRVL